MSMNWRDVLGRAGENLRKRRTVNTNRGTRLGTWGPADPLDGGSKAPAQRKRRRRPARGAAASTGRAPRKRASRRTAGGTPAQRAWRQRFGEMSRAGQLPKRRSRNRMLRS